MIGRSNSSREERNAVAFLVAPQGIFAVLRIIAADTGIS